MTDRFLKGNEASKILNVHQRTLYQWEKKGWIETIRTKGNVRKYNVDKYLRETNSVSKQEEVICSSELELKNINKCKGKININYIRVSSISQKDDYERQEKELKIKYPKNKIIKDIGSGVNLGRRGLIKIIELAIEGKINELVVAYKDRLTRFGFELIEHIIKKYSNGKIIILNDTDEKEPEDELVQDVLQIMNVFIARMNGLRKYKTKRNNKHIEKNNKNSK